MRTRTLAHVSDLHVGRSSAQDRATGLLVDLLREAEIDHVVVTGDLTHRGRHRELRRFLELFAPLLVEGRVTLLPGNHDRVGEDSGATLMRGRRVEARTVGGLYLVKVDSTGPHNRSYFQSHGDLSQKVLREVEEALDRAPAGHLCAIALHHHVLPLPEESVAEWFASQLGWPHAEELALGSELLGRVMGKCDLVLHGHRHRPRSFVIGDGARPLRIFNAGSSSELLRYRVFEHRDGALVGEPSWARVVPTPVPLLSRIGARVPPLDLTE